MYKRSLHISDQSGIVANNNKQRRSWVGVRGTFWVKAKTFLTDRGGGYLNHCHGGDIFTQPLSRWNPIRVLATLFVACLSHEIAHLELINPRGT